MDGGGGPAPRVPARSSNPLGTSPPAHAGPAGHRRPARRHAGPVARPGATCRPRHCASPAGTRAIDPGSVSRPCPRGSAPSASRTSFRPMSPSPARGCAVQPDAAGCATFHAARREARRSPRTGRARPMHNPRSTAETRSPTRAPETVGQLRLRQRMRRAGHRWRAWLDTSW